MMDMFSLKGKVTVITGAAGLLGRGMSLALAKAGSDMAICGHVKSGIEDTAQMIREAAPQVNVRTYMVDICDEDSVRQLRENVMADFGHVDVLVNNAAQFGQFNAEDMTFEDWKRVVHTNLDGTFLMSREFGRVMIGQKKGSIINISSKSGLTADVPNNQVGYNTSKAGLIMLTKSLATEWGKYNIRVNAICPGNFVKDSSHYYPEKGNAWEERWILNIPMNRFGIPEELGGVVVYLASDASSYTTGAVEMVDGGYTIT